MRNDYDDYANNHNRHETLDVCDTSECLTKAELIELKKLAQLSITTRWIVGFVFAIIAVTGLPAFASWIGKILKLALQ